MGKDRRPEENSAEPVGDRDDEVNRGDDEVERGKRRDVGAFSPIADYCRPSARALDDVAASALITRGVPSSSQRDANHGIWRMRILRRESSPSWSPWNAM